jgi:hypothetical protein
METSKTRRFNLEMRRLAERKGRDRANTAEPASLWAASDFPMDQLLKHMEINPIGQLLKLIAALPDVRYEKIERARQQLSLSDEALNARLDVALDRVLEELTTEG